MGRTLAAELHTDEPRLRVTEGDARTALRTVVGRPVVPARARLRFGPGRTCEPVARLLDRAIAQAEGAGLDPGLLIVADGSVQPAEDIVRVRRRAHGKADWIRSPTCAIQIILRPAGLHATAGPHATAGLDRPAAAETGRSRHASPLSRAAPGVPAQAGVPAEGVPAESADERVTAVRAALSDVIDPDLGVNIVDLGIRPRCRRRGAHGRHRHDPHLRSVPPHRRHGESDPRRARPARRHRDTSASTGNGYPPGGRPTSRTPGVSCCAPSASPFSPQAPTCGRHILA